MNDDHHTLLNQSLEKPLFSAAIRQLSDTLAGLREFVEVVQPVLEQHCEAVVRESAGDILPLLLVVNEVLPDLCPADSAVMDKIRKRFDGQLSLRVDEHDSHKSVTLSIRGPGQKPFDAAINKFVRSHTHIDLLYRNALISLVSSSEWFMSQLLHSHFESFPEAAGLQDKTLTLNELRAFRSMDDATKYLIDLKVEDILRGSVEDWITFLKNKIKLQMGYIKDVYGTIIEIIQRRNLIVHNAGFINEIYRRKVPIEHQAEHNPNQMISVSEQYLETAISLFERVFVLIAAELWKKCKPDDDSRGDLLTEIAFNHLTGKRWNISEGLSYFVMNDGGLSERIRLIGKVNFWQSLKWQGRFQEVEADIIACDFSAKREDFRLARFALLDDADSFFKLLPRALEAGTLSNENLYSWPLFKKMRETEQYRLFSLKADGH